MYLKYNPCVSKSCLKAKKCLGNYLNYLLVLELNEELSKHKINGLNHKGIKSKALTT